MSLRSANATKHGITARKHSFPDEAFVERLTTSIIGSATDIECLDLAGQIAEIQSKLALLRREKASAWPTALAQDSGNIQVSPHSSLPAELAAYTRRLATLDEYERKLISRRRKLGFKLLAAKECC